MNTKNPNTAISLLEITNEAKEIIKEITQKLTAVDSLSAVNSINNRAAASLSYLADNFADISRVCDVVTDMEFAQDTLKEVVEARKIKYSGYEDIVKRANLVSQRMYRNQWTAAKTADATATMFSLFVILGIPKELRFWQDTPMRNWNETNLWGGYSKLNAPITGLVVFSHCYGFTFIEYKKGKAVPSGWTVTLDGMDDAIRAARYCGSIEASKIISATQIK